MITHVKFVSIPVKDYDRALKFYTEKLDFKLLMDQSFGDGSRWIELQVADSQTKVVLFTPQGHENRIGTIMNLNFTCDDVKNTYDNLSKRGVEFTKSPTEAPWGIYAQFTDSEGNLLLLSSSDHE
ncbi:MAG: VOC family protein [Bacteroidota bacterium]|nr:VOC family protein [Bacteroidota bacterium]